MEIKNKKSKPLFWLFLKQLLFLAILILAELLLIIVLFTLGMKYKVILPANYSEKYLEQNEVKISESQPFDEKLIPHTCKYGLFDFGGNYLLGDFSEDTITAAQNYLNNSDGKKKKLFAIKRADGYCVVDYDISAHFVSPYLHKIFPKLELALTVLVVLCVVLTVVQIARNFGKKLRKELTPLLSEINQIQNRDINVSSRKKSRIKEFDEVLLSFYDMKDALSESLKKEWETEQRQKTNISALAHDIKTPLTIIKGNSELISEEDDVEEIYKLADTINKNSDKIEKYISLLIDQARNNTTADDKSKVNLAVLASNINSQSEALCKPFNVDLVTLNNTGEVVALLNADSIERAILNLIKNAIEHTKENKKINLNIETTPNRLIVTIEDFGNGFSPEALIKAKKQFYTENSARGGEHYGLGLYFANTVAEKHNGKVTCTNKKDNLGSVVTFEIDITQ